PTPFARYDAVEHPVATPRPREVFLLHPGGGLLVVTPPRPPPDPPKDRSVHLGKGALARRVPVVQRPAADLRVQPLDKLPGRQRAPFFPDDPLFLGQERPHVLPRRLEEYLAAAVTPHVLAEEVEAVFAMRDPGLLVGEFETPLSKEVLHEGLDSVA